MKFKLQLRFYIIKYSFALLLATSFFLFYAQSVKAEYKIGIDYHATGADFAATSFLAQYEKPEVRALVRAQLQSMVNNGARIISTRYWMYDSPGARFPGLYNRLGFPLSTQELANLKQYVVDVTNIKDKNGNPPDLYLVSLGGGCADWNLTFASVCPQKTLTQVIDTYKLTYKDIFDSVGNLKKIKNGKSIPAIDTFFMDGEVRLTNDTVNRKIFILQAYPYFTNLAQQYGIKTSMYSVVDHGPSYTIQANTQPDSHLKWVNAMFEYLASTGLPQPETIDISAYIDPVDGNFDTTINHIIADIKAKYPNKSIKIMETYYPQDPVVRKIYGQSWADSYSRIGQPLELTFWTTPNSDIDGDNVGYPFDIASYLPQVMINSAILNTSFTPWVVSLKGFNLKSNLLSRFYDTNQTRWGKDNPIALATDKTWVSARFPGNIPPSNCNIGKTCTIYVSLFDPEKNMESNKIGVTIPATIKGDFNFDGKVDLKDFNLLKIDFTKYYSIFDYNVFVQNFGK